MLIQRIITFIVLGFFVFIGGVGSWWQPDGFTHWLGIYCAWFGVICLWIWALRRASPMDIKPTGED